MVTRDFEILQQLPEGLQQPLEGRSSVGIDALYSSFFSGSLGIGFSMGLRGSIWSRMAAS